MTVEPTSHEIRHYEERLLEIEAKLDKLSGDVEDLVSAWKAANWLVGFVKWAGGLATAVVAIYSLLKMKV
jgi:hypothetical protein